MVDRLTGDTEDLFGISIDHQRVVQQETLSGAISSRAYTFNLTEPAKIDFRGIANHKRPPIGQPLGQLPMGTRNGFKRNVLAIKQSVCSFEVAPCLGLIGKTRRWIASDLFSHSNQAIRPSLVS